MQAKIIVIGGSAGSLRVVAEIVRNLPRDLNAAIFVILHSVPRQRSLVPEILNALEGLPARQAEEGDKIRPGEIYVAPPDRHMVIAKDHIHLSRGPKEGLQRPSINVTFRSAAITYDERVIGVLLSGLLDDGAAGIWEIANRGGTTIVQNPEDAAYSSMPLNALRDASVDHVVSGQEIGPLLIRLLSPAEERKSIKPPEQQGAQMFSGFTCPECRGPLYETRTGGPREFRCRVGHVMSLQTLMSEETSTQERKLYEAMVALEEGADLAEYAVSNLQGADVEALVKEAEQLRKHVQLLKSIIEERVVPSVS